MPRYYRRRSSRRFIRRRPIRRRAPIRRRRYGRVRRGRKRAPYSLPFKRHVKLAYTELKTPVIVPGSGPVGYYSWRLNSAFDPNSATGSYGIPGFKEYSAFFQYYRVNAVKVWIQAQNVAQIPIYVGVRVLDPRSETILTTPTWNEFMEMKTQGRVRSTMLSVPNSGKSQKTITYYADFGKLYGNRLQWRTAGEFDSLVTSNPHTIFWAQIFVADTNGVGTTVPAVTMNLKMTYYISFWGKKTLFTSSLTSTADEEDNVTNPNPTTNNIAVTPGDNTWPT